ncbi:MAG: type II secretion system protein [Candidatus Paceibacterota bacterium]
MRNYIYQKGVTLVEMLVVVAIIGLLAGVVSAFQTDIFSFQRLFSNNLDLQRDGLFFLKKFTSEIRSVVPSETGTYAFGTVGTSTLLFYVDEDHDGVSERIRYYLEDEVLYRAKLVPTGSPLSYTGTETVTEVISHVKNATSTPTPIFTYYDQAYTGIGGTPLAQPVTASDVRLVKVTLFLDADTSDAQPEITLTTHVMARNLKDNL